MPQFDVTLNAEFVVNSLSVTVNGTDNLSGTSLENALTLSLKALLGLLWEYL